LPYHARELEWERGKSITPLLDELDRSISIRFKDSTGNNFHWTNVADWYPKTEGVSEERLSYTFLALTIQAGLRLYVKENLDGNQALIAEKYSCPLLDCSLRPAKRLHTENVPAAPHQPGISDLAGHAESRPSDGAFITRARIKSKPEVSRIPGDRLVSLPM
jgi:hypothetical protein